MIVVVFTEKTDIDAVFPFKYAGEVVAIDDTVEDVPAGLAKLLITAGRAAVTPPPEG